jgi:2'-5' RNA ligase
MARTKGTLSAMVATEPASAIVVRIAVPPALERSRRQWDWAAGAGVPAHVTILFPFLPVGRLEPAVRAEVAAIAAAHDPFDVRFRRLGRFPGVVYLEPEPSAPFANLTEAVVRRFPDFPPYDGAFAEVVPHLTVAESEAAPLDEIAAHARAVLPFERRVSALEVIVEGGDGRWRTCWRLPLGRPGG